MFVAEAYITKTKRINVKITKPLIMKRSNYILKVCIEVFFQLCENFGLENVLESWSAGIVNLNLMHIKVIHCWPTVYYYDITTTTSPIQMKSAELTSNCGLPSDKHF